MKKLPLIVTILFFTNTVQAGDKIAYWAPYYTATKGDVTLRILGVVHTLSGKVISKDTLSEIHACEALITEINGDSIFDEEQVIANTPKIDEPEIDLDVVLDVLFAEESRLTPKRLIANMAAKDLHNPSPDFLENEVRWSADLELENKLKLTFILKQLLEDKGRSDELAFLSKYGLDGLNPEILEYVIKYKLEKFKVREPSYGLGYFINDGMDQAIRHKFLVLEKKIYRFECSEDRINAEPTAPQTLKEKLETLRNIAYPQNRAKYIAEYLRDLELVLEGLSLKKLSCNKTYETRPAPTEPYDEATCQYYAGKEKPSDDKSLIVRNKLWCERLIEALDKSMLKEKNIALLSDVHIYSVKVISCSF